ncbi:hypothetical protein OSB04_002158 [Centaurea solstitialis]|uniref:Uncharacterized protein n=1 Tax=Centaurea solstitialis TaxID=347529 RepID=A0AA38WM33_9ASTR|nr:hypothetical protein OSB04_002158 [Centaurea solstitialis]
MLKKFNMTDCSPIKTPMPTGNLLGPDLAGKPVDQKIYRSMIGSLLYLTATRPDIMFATCFCARFQANPKESQLAAVKRILRYLKGTPELGLWYPKDSSFELISFTDSDYGGCKLDRKSTSGSCQFLGDKLVSWTSKKQNCVSTSTAEAEYVAAASCCSQVLWMKTQLLDYGYKLKRVPIYCDSESAIAITSNPVQHSKTKHIDIRYHFIKDNVEKGNIEMFFVQTDYQLADLFTKPLDEKHYPFEGEYFKVIFFLGGEFKYALMLTYLKDEQLSELESGTTQDMSFDVVLGILYDLKGKAFRTEEEIIALTAIVRHVKLGLENWTSKLFCHKPRRSLIGDEKDLVLYTVFYDDSETEISCVYPDSLGNKKRMYSHEVMLYCDDTLKMVMDGLNTRLQMDRQNVHDISAADKVLIKHFVQEIDRRLRLRNDIRFAEIKFKLRRPSVKQKSAESRRDQRKSGGKHDPNRFLAMKGRKLEIPTFDGKDPDGWILRADKYFALNQLSQKEKIDVSFIAFEGDALKCFNGRIRDIRSVGGRI